MVDKRKGADGTEAPIKRQRVSRACDQCRAAREKCDGIQPMCFTCVSSNRNCSYTTPPKKRGIQPGYIRTLELTLAWVFENAPGSEAALKAGLSQEKIAALLSGKDADGSYKLHKTWRRSGACKELERLLGSTKSGHTSTPDADSGPDETYLEPVLAIRHLPGVASTPDGPFGVKLPQNLWRLLDVYFAYTHTWLPIIQKHDMLKLAYTYGEQGLELRAGDQPEHAELWALLALAAVQDEAVHPVPFSERTDADIYATARRLVPGERCKQSVSHVKALLLLALINIGSGGWTAAWLLVGQALNIALDLGLHKPSQTDYTRSKHTILACFFLDSLLCSRLDRRSRLSTSDIAAIGPVDEEGLEEWHPWTGCDGFLPNLESHRGSGGSLTRAPNHSMSIFNQLVMASNGLRSINVPVHLRTVDARTSTPQLLHLHIFHACYASATDRAHQLFSDFAQRFGVAAMPALFRVYADVALRGENRQLARETADGIDSIASTINDIWTGSVPGGIADHSAEDHSITHATSPNLPKDIFATPTSLQNLQQSPLHNMMPPRRGTIASNVDASASTVEAKKTQEFDSRLSAASLPSASPNPLMHKSDDIFPLERYNSHGSIDIEALFDELASLDGADNADHQPLFMQNLGLAPNADLNDVLGPDFGFDPLLSTYINTASTVSERARTFPGG